MQNAADISGYRPDWKLYAEVILLSLLCASQYVGITALNLVITAAVLGVYFLMDRMEDCTVGLFTALPMFNMMSIRLGTISLYYLMVFLFWLRYFLYHNWTIQREKFLVLFVLLVIRLTSGEIRDNLTWFVLFSVLVLTYREDYFDRNIQTVVLFVSITFIISSAVGYWMLENGKSIYTNGTVWSKSGVATRFAGVIGDSVFFSQFCALMVAANLTLGCYNRRYLLPALLLSVIISVLCLESYAKTGMLLIVLAACSAAVWLIWNRLKDKRTALVSIGMAVGCVGAVVFLVEYILTHTDNPLIQNYIARLTSKDLLTGRNAVWEHYLGLLGSRWGTLLFAMPQSMFRAPFRVDHHYLSATHNVYLESLCFFGLVGTVCILLWLIARMYRCFISRKGILYFMPICVMLASGFSLHGLNEYHYYTLLAIAISFLNCDSLEESTPEKLSCQRAEFRQR